MNTTTVERVSRWVERRFGDRQGAVTRAELVQTAEQDGLPQDVQNVLEGLPEGPWPVGQLEPLVRDALMVQIGGPTQGILP